MIGSRSFIVTMSKNAFVGIRDSNPVRNAFLHQPNAFGLYPESLNDFVPIQEPVYAFHLVENVFPYFENEISAFSRSVLINLLEQPRYLIASSSLMTSFSTDSTLLIVSPRAILFHFNLVTAMLSIRPATDVLNL